MIVKKFPFTIDNPNYDRPVEELPQTSSLREENRGAQVVELYNGAPLPELNLTRYDGARDVFFQEEEGGIQGTQVGYFYDWRWDLSLGIQQDTIRPTALLIKFDLSMLQKDVKVKKAKLMLYANKITPKTAPGCKVYGIKRRWHEYMVGARGAVASRQVCELLTFAPVPVGKEELWDKPMAKGAGDRHSEPVATGAFPTPGWAEIDITSAAQNWLSGQWENHGVLLEPTDPKAVVQFWASDYQTDPSLRPRLSLALEGATKPVAHRVEELNADLEQARAMAKTEKKRILCNLLTAGSITSRNFETKVLMNPEVKKYVDANFVELRLNADDLKYRAVLKAYDVRNLPAALVIAENGEGKETFERIEPFEWNAQFGHPPTCFEFEQSYTALLQKALDKCKAAGRLPYRREDSGEIRRDSGRIPEGCNFGPSGGLLKNR